MTHGHLPSLQTSVLKHHTETASSSVQELESPDVQREHLLVLRGDPIEKEDYFIYDPACGILSLVMAHETPKSHYSPIICKNFISKSLSQNVITITFLSSAATC